MKPRRFWQSLWIPVLLLAVILALGACGERRGAETPTPTSPPRIPEATVSPTVSEPPASQEVTASPEVSPSPEATASPTELPPTPSPSPSWTPTPEDPAFGELTFSRILQPSGVLGPQGLLFPPGTERVYASAAYRNMRPDLRFEERWYRNDELWITRANIWHERSAATAGTLIFESLSIHQGLPPGQYRVELFVGGDLATAGHFIILQAPTETPTPTFTHTYTPTPTHTWTPVPTATPTWTATSTATPTLDKAAIRRLAFRAAAYLLVPKADGSAPSVGTGIIVDGRGLILTNYHLVADPWSRVLYNPSGRVEVGVSPDPESQPVHMAYVAEVLLTDPDLDLAILHIKTDLQGRPLPRTGFLPWVALGDDRQLVFAPDVHTAGYPAGAQRGVVLRGIYTGHSSDGRWIELAAPFFDGYSGGMAINDDALLMGIINSYRQSQQDPRTSRYYLRPVNLAKKIIAEGRYYLDYGILPATPTPAPPHDAPLGVVTAPDGLNIRSEPGVEHPSLWKAPRGTVLLLSTRRQSDSTGQLWREVWAKDRPLRGWAAEAYIQVLDPNVLRPPAPPDMIAFASNRSGRYQIHVMRSDGSEQRNLSNNAYNDTSPSWSPDRTRLAFVSDRDGNNEIYTMRYDGTDVRRLTFSPSQELHPAWSPDGSRIAYVSNVDGDWEIWTMNADGSAPRQWTRNTQWDSYPSWSPDGRYLAFTSERDGNYEIYRIDLQTGQETRLTDHPASDAFPAWSPSGHELAFISARHGRMDVYVLLVNHPEVEPQRIPISASDTDLNRYPVWSPDGLELVFTSWRDGHGEIYAVTRQGQNLRNLTGTLGDDEHPAWR